MNDYLKTNEYQNAEAHQLRLSFEFQVRSELVLQSMVFKKPEDQLFFSL
jgi:hypothetical protein